MRSARVLAVVALLLTACGSDNKPDSFTVGGTVSGLAGSGLELLNNGDDYLSVTKNGPFNFHTAVAPGTPYSVRVSAQPISQAQNCVVMNPTGSGTVSNANVTSVSITCINVGRFLYVANRDSDSVSAFVIDAATGTLAPISGSPFATVLHPVAVAVDPAGRFAYVAGVAYVSGMFQGAVAAYAIDPGSGALAPIAGGGVSSPVGILSLTVDPTSKYVYVTNGAFGDSRVSVFSIDQKSGALTAVPGSPFRAGASPASVAFDRNLHFATVANSGDEYTWLAGDVWAYAIDASTGALTPSNTLSSPCSDTALKPGIGGPYPFSVVVEPSGRFGFVQTGPRGNVWRLLLDASGEIGSNTCAGPLFGGDLHFHPGGKFAYSLCAPNVCGFTFDVSSGSLAPLTDSSGPTVSGWSSLSLDPSGRFAFAFCAGDLCTFSIDGDTGAVQALASLGLPDITRRFVALHPNGKFAYTLDVPDGITAYAVDAQTGALATLPIKPAVARRRAGGTCDLTGWTLCVHRESQLEGCLGLRDRCGIGLPHPDGR